MCQVGLVAGWQPQSGKATQSACRGETRWQGGKGRGREHAGCSYAPSASGTVGALHTASIQPSKLPTIQASNHPSIQVEGEGASYGEQRASGGRK